MKKTITLFVAALVVGLILFAAPLANAGSIHGALYYTGDGFDTFVFFKNTTSSTISVTVTFQPMGGAPAAASPVNVPGGEMRSVTALPVVGSNSFGSMEVSWSGNARGIIGSTTTVNFTDGIAVDAPLQSVESEGFVKAAAYVSLSGSLTRSFNTVSDATTTASRTFTGVYNIDFGVDFDDRYFSCTTYGTTPETCGVALGSGTSINVFVFNETGSPRNSHFWLLVY